MLELIGIISLDLSIHIKIYIGVDISWILGVILAQIYQGVLANSELLRQKEILIKQRRTFITIRRNIGTLGHLKGYYVDRLTRLYAETICEMGENKPQQW